MIEVGDVEADAYEPSTCCHTRGLEKAFQLMVAHCIEKPGQKHEQDDEKIVVGHLYMIGQHLEAGEEGSDDEAPQIFAAESKHDAANHRRKIGQSHHFPDVACGDDDEKIA